MPKTKHVYKICATVLPYNPWLSAQCQCSRLENVEEKPETRARLDVALRKSQKCYAHVKMRH